MDGLKECPFCGGRPEVFCNDGVQIVCMSCHCGTFVNVDTCIDDCEKHPAIDRVKNAWNNRPKPIQPEEYEGTFYCTKCHEPVEKGDKYCHECGRGLKWGG